MRVLIISLLAISGCGVRFADIPQFNKGLPEDFKRRVLWSETDIFKYNLEQLVGHIIYSGANPDEYDRGTRYVNPAKPPALKAVDSGTIYHSKIDIRAAQEGKYLAFAAKMEANQTADVSIIDSAQVFVAYDDVPMSQLLDEAKKPKPTPATKRYYIQGVLLATITTQYGTKIDGNASGVVGDTFGAKGNVYNEEATLSKDFRISLLLIDIDRLAELKSAPGIRPPSNSELLLGSRAGGFDIGTIKGLEATVIPSPGR